MAVNFAERRKEAEDAGLIGGGDYLKLKEGDNRLRLMSECLPHAGTYQGKSNFKWLCYVLDRRDGKVKPFFMPHKIYKAIEALQMNPDYEFDDVPMPYDVTVNALKAGTKDVVYTIVPARKNTPVTEAEAKDLAAAKPLADLQKALKEKQQKAAPSGPDGDNTPLPDDDDYGHE